VASSKEKKFRFFETESFCDQAAGKRLYQGIESPDGIIVHIAGVLYFLFNFVKAFLQHQKVSACFEVRIRLCCRHKSDERPGYLAFLLLPGCNGFIFRAYFGGFFQDVAFMPAVALDGIDKVWNKVMAALQGNINAASFFLYHVFQLDKLVICRDKPDKRKNDKNYEGKYNLRLHYITMKVLCRFGRKNVAESLIPHL